jgi:DNA-binding NarL/FixJ family response regulator
LAVLKARLEEQGLEVEVVRLESALTPDVGLLPMSPGSACIVDACYPAAAAHSLAAAVLARCPEGPVLVLLEEVTDGAAFPLLRIGVKGIVSYAEASRQLLPALRALAGGGCWVPRSAIARFLDDMLATAAPALPRGPHPLSRRERAVLAWLQQNFSNKEIGDRLNISERTVKFHVSSLLAKFSVQRRAELILSSLRPERPPAWPREHEARLAQVSPPGQ